MRIHSAKEVGSVCEFVFEGPQSAANYLRRSIIAYSKSVAIDCLHIHENTTNVCDELIVDALSMVPLCGRESLTDILEGQKRAVCNTATFNLHVSGRDVTTDDLKTTSGVRPVHKSTILPMRAGQTLRLDAEAVLGCGSRHTFWCPIVAPAYKIVAPNTFRFTFETNANITLKQALGDALQQMQMELTNTHRAVVAADI